MHLHSAAGFYQSIIPLPSSTSHARRYREMATFGSEPPSLVCVQDDCASDVSFQSEPPTPELNSTPTSEPVLRAKPARRPSLNRFYSSPDLLSPGRQHFRLRNLEHRPVKVTPSIIVTEDANGRSVNQYKIIKSIGRGTYGNVYLAVDTETGQNFAIKEYSKNHILKANRKRIMQLRRQGIVWKGKASDLVAKEIAILKKVDHPNLVTLHEVLEDDVFDSLFMVMEYCENGPLMDTDSALGGVCEESCRLYFRDMVLAVEYLHAQGIAHRDIKTENVLLTDDQCVKIADFGVSEILEDPENDSLASCVGSPAYFAPELVQLASGSQVTNADRSVISGRKTDIWALGVTLYHIYHGHLPFQADNMEDLYDSIRTVDPEYASSISADLKDLLMRMLCKDPAQRITIADIREHAWVTSHNSDTLLSTEENCCTTAEAVTEDDLKSAIEKTRLLYSNADLNIADVTRSLARNYGWRGKTVPSNTPSPQPGNGSGLNVTKLVRALDEIIKKKDWRN